MRKLSAFISFISFISFITNTMPQANGIMARNWLNGVDDSDIWRKDKNWWL
jgi:hypothetical protein